MATGSIATLNSAAIAKSEIDRIIRNKTGPDTITRDEVSDYWYEIIEKLYATTGDIPADYVVTGRAAAQIGNAITWAEIPAAQKEAGRTDFIAGEVIDVEYDDSPATEEKWRNNPVGGMALVDTDVAVAGPTPLADVATAADRTSIPVADLYFGAIVKQTSSGLHYRFRQNPVASNVAANWEVMDYQLELLAAADLAPITEPDPRQIVLIRDLLIAGQPWRYRRNAANTQWVELESEITTSNNNLGSVLEMLAIASPTNGQRFMVMENDDPNNTWAVGPYKFNHLGNSTWDYTGN